MGIYFDNEAEDVKVIQEITAACVADWNDRFSSIEGVVLRLEEQSQSATVASTVSGKILDNYLPPNPDAYKRVAALLVTMSLHPFINGRRENAQGLFIEVLHGDWLRYFGIASLVDSLGAYFNPFEQQNDKGQWVQLDQWPGFAQADIRSELILLLYSYSKSNILEFENRQLAYHPLQVFQAILSVSLTLKAIYPV
jgi:hypothetical protein